jgi:uncharacterized membrane protein YciS (DUF1049 family)
MPILIILLMVAVLAIAVSLQNAVQISVSMLFWKFESSLALVLLVTFAIGMVVGLFVISPALLKRKFMVSKQQKKIRELEGIIRGDGDSSEE